LEFRLKILHVSHVRVSWLVNSTFVRGGFSFAVRALDAPWRGIHVKVERAKRIDRPGEEGEGIRRERASLGRASFASARSGVRPSARSSERWSDLDAATV
jgi:hypothetical protein